MTSAHCSVLSKPLASIIVPAYNEGRALTANVVVLERCLSHAQTGYEHEIIVVDDGSTDDTYQNALALSEQMGCLRVIRHAVNRGLGCAIRTGFGIAKGSIAVVYDSDLSYAPDIIPRLLSHIDRNACDLVLASPYMRGGKVLNVPFLRRFLSREGNRFLSFAVNGRYATVTCMVRAYRLAFFKTIDSREARMEINPELFFKALAHHARIEEIPAALVWSAERAKSRARMNLVAAAKQSWRTMRYGIAYRPAVLLALPGILPGVLPLVVAIAALLRLDLRTIAAITLVTMIVQNTSLALFAGQLAMFGRNVLRHAPAKAHLKDG